MSLMRAGSRSNFSRYCPVVKMWTVQIGVSSLQTRDQILPMQTRIGHTLMQGEQLVRNNGINGAHQREILRLGKNHRHPHPQELVGHGGRLGDECSIVEKCACDEDVVTS